NALSKDVRVRVPHPVRTLSRGLIEVAAHCPHRGPVLRGRIILSRRLTCPRSEVLGHSAARPRGSHIVRCMVAETHSPPYGLADTAGHRSAERRAGKEVWRRRGGSDERRT